MSATTSDRLKQSTWACHQRLEQSAFHRALQTGQLPLAAYVGWLRALTAIHAELERKLDQSDQPAVRALWQPQSDPGQRRLPLLQQDLLHFRYELLPDVTEAVRHTLEYVACLRQLGTDDGPHLLGIFYVLEGAKLGATLLQPLLARTFALRTAGLRYFCPPASGLRQHWQGFRQQLDQALPEVAQQDRAIAAAQELYSFMARLLSLLGDCAASEQRFFSFSFNPQSGNHPVHQQPEVLLAALRATDRCLAEWPYFRQRYGHLGHLFGDSDGAWLASLPPLGSKVVIEQCNWLAGVLAARGMPSFLLARHLELLCDELTRACPLHASDWQLLQQAADSLDPARDDAPAAALLQALPRLSHQAGLPDNSDSQAAAQLLVHALLDEQRRGRGQAADLLQWLTGATDRSATSCAALQRLLTAAQTLLKGTP